jgi:hypothetical protein
VLLREIRERGYEGGVSQLKAYPAYGAGNHRWHGGLKDLADEYGFRPRLCRPGLNTWFERRCVAQWHTIRHPEQRERTVAEVWEDERPHLMQPRHPSMASSRT